MRTSPLISLDSALGQFLAGTFHQDWRLDHSSMDDAVADVIRWYSSKEYTEHLKTLLTELQIFLRTMGDADETEYERQIHAVCDYVVGYDQTNSYQMMTSYRAWLRHIASRLAEAVGCQ